jgi:hypothetical protein
MEFTRAGPWRGGDNSDKVKGPGALAGSRGPERTKSCALNGGLRRPNHTLQKGSGKYNMAVTCHSFSQLMVGTRPYHSCSFGPEGPKGLQKGSWEV